MMTDPDIKSLCAISDKIQLRYLFVTNCTNSHSHQFICTQAHLATSVSITMATHCQSLHSPEAICKCPLSFPLPSILFFHPFLHLALLFCIFPFSLSVHFLSQRCSSSSGGMHTVTRWLIIKRLIGGIKLLCTQKKKVHILYIPACAFNCGSFPTSFLAQSPLSALFFFLSFLFFRSVTSSQKLSS